MNLFLTAKAFVFDHDVFGKFLSWIETKGSQKRMISITTGQRNVEEKNTYADQFKELVVQSGFEKIEFIDIEFEDPRET